MTRTRRCALLMLPWLLCAHLAQGQPNPASTVEPSRSGDAEYDQLIEKAVVEFNLGHWGEAKAFFVRAHQLRPNARTFRSLGLTSYEQRLYVDALGYFQSALLSEQTPLTAAQREQVSHQLAEVRSFVTRVRLTLEPSTLSLHVDGKDPIYDQDGQLLLDPGEHELSAEAAGHEPQVRALTAHGAEQIELKLSLTPLLLTAAVEPPRVPEPLPLPEPRRAEPSSGTWLGTPQWVGIGLAGGGVVAAAVGGVFSLLATNANSDSKRSCTATRCDDTGRAYRETALARADVATGSFIAAGVLVAAGAVSFFAIPSGERRPASAWRVTPVVDQQTAAVTLGRAF
jgi:hypothetical protein